MGRGEGEWRACASFCARSFLRTASYCVLVRVAFDPDLPVCMIDELKTRVKARVFSSTTCVTSVIYGWKITECRSQRLAVFLIQSYGFSHIPVVNL
eukprot:1196304-Pleurochrysis_carterae.AAC.1